MTGGRSGLWAACLAVLMGVVTLRADESGPLSGDQLAALEGVARDRFAIRWTELGTNGLSVLHTRAAAYEEALRERHLPHGLLVSLRHAAPGSDTVVALRDLDLASGWTGFLLASTAYRFSVTRDPSALAAARRVLDGVERLLEVSGLPGFVAAYAGPAADPAAVPITAPAAAAAPGAEATKLSDSAASAAARRSSSGAASAFGGAPP